MRVVPVLVPTAVAAALRLTVLADTPTDPFYDAAIRSMSQSWHNFLFAAFEPGGGTSVDKPPLGLWLQVAGVKLFGWGALGRVIPQALASSLAVPLLYDLVRRLFGRPAAFASALALAVLPVSVLVGRSNTPDALVSALTLLAAWLIVRYVESGSTRFLYLAAMVVGLSFEVKLFEGLLAVPALIVLYGLASRGALRARPRHVTAALSLFLVVALAWPTAVSLAPSSSRPYAIGSTDGSVWSAFFIYNGLDRLDPAGPAVAMLTAPQWLRRSGNTPGPLRLFQLGGRQFGRTIGVELAPALVFGAIALSLGLLAELRRRASGRSPPTLQRAGAFAFAVWLLTGFLVLSRRPIVYSRYVEVIAPAAAVALGASIATCCAVLGDRRRLALVPLALGLIVTTGYALVLAGGDEPLAIVTIAAASCAAALALRAKGQALALAAGLCCLVALLAPAIVRSARIVEVDASATGGTGAHPLPWVGLLSSYLARHDHHAYYELAAHSYPHAAPFIVKDGRPVLVLMNFNRPIVGVRRLASEARAGRVRYALIEGRCGTARLGSIGRCPATLQWLRRHSVDVTAATGWHTRGVLFRIARRSGRRAAGRGGHGG